MRITLTDRIRALFSKDEFDYWFKQFTDDEKEILRMDSWELAKVIVEENNHNGNSQKRIIAEHMLQVRLIKLQNRATYISMFVGFAGIALGSFLTIMFQK